MYIIVFIIFCCFASFLHAGFLSVSIFLVIKATGTDLNATCKELFLHLDRLHSLGSKKSDFERCDLIGSLV